MMRMNRSGSSRSREPFTIPIRVYGVASSGAETARLRELVRELQAKLDDACRQGLFTAALRRKASMKKKSKKISPSGRARAKRR